MAPATITVSGVVKDASGGVLPARASKRSSRHHAGDRLHRIAMSQTKAHDRPRSGREGWSDRELLGAGIALFEALYRALAQADLSSGPRAVALAEDEEGSGPRAPEIAMPAVVTAPSGAVSSEPAATAAFARLCVIGFLAYCSYAVCRTPLLPLLAQDLGATPPVIGFVVGASTLTGIVLKLPAGAWSDLLGRRPLLVAGTIVFAAMPFTYLAVASLGALIAARFVHGAATAILGPVASASLSDVAPPARRATWLSTYSTVQGAGQALGPVVAGYLIAARRYDLAFLAAGLCAAATPFIAMRWPRSTPPLPSPHRTRHFLTGIVDVCRHPLILLTSLTQAAQFVLNGALSAFLPLFARDQLGLSASQLGWLFALQSVTTLATRPLMGIVSDRIGRRRLIVTGLSLCSGAVWLVSLVEGPRGLVLAVAAYSAGVAVTTAATSAFITDLSQRARYGTAHGVFGSIYDVGDALGPIAAGLLVAAIGYPQMFRVMAAVGFTMAMVFAAATRTQPDRVATRET